MATTRRTFLTQSSATVAGAVALNLASQARAQSANDKIVMGCIGVGGQGTNLLQSFAQQPNVQIAYICDVDREHAEKAAASISGDHKPQIVRDMRQVLDDKNVDAVTVATPDHWHAPATILACNAGKHVYVEKPCSHNIREGRLQVEAARRNKVVVQVGTQSRSMEHVREGIQLLKDGAIGEVLVAKAWNSQRRSNIGHANPSDAPATLDYDTWVGPAPMVPYQANRLHYNWHWWYDFGTGDAGNDGVHEIDIARWGLGVEQHPELVASIGGKSYFDDDQQFPDTQYVSFEYPNANLHRKQLVFEMRIWSPYTQDGHENGDAFYGTEGMLILGKRNGWQLFGPRNELRDQRKGGSPGSTHHVNFLDCIRSGERPNADIEIGHLSATLCHLGNIATRVGRTLRFDPASEQIASDPEANALVTREYRDHWGVPKNV